MPSLIALNGNTPGRIYDIQGERFSIGSKANTDLPLDDESISEQHAELHFENGHWKLSDLESSKGSIHNGSRIDTSELQHGDRLAFGDLEFRFRETESQTIDTPINPKPAHEIDLAGIIDVNDIHRIDIYSAMADEAALRKTGTLPEVPDTSGTSNSSTAPEAPSPTHLASVEDDLSIAHFSTAKISTARQPSTSKNQPVDFDKLSLDDSLIKWIEKRRDVLYTRMDAILAPRACVDLLLCSLLAEGHVLLNAPTGLGRSNLIYQFAEALDFHSNRLVCSPDLSREQLAEDGYLQDKFQAPKLGSPKRLGVYSDPTAFSNLVIAKDIENASRGTQTDLLNGLLRSRFEVGNYGYFEPFFFVATCNRGPNEHEYRLTNPQRQSFAIEIRLEYPDEANEIKQLEAALKDEEHVPNLEAAFNKNQLIQLQDLVRGMALLPGTQETAVRWVRATRPNHPEAPEIVRNNILDGANPKSSKRLIQVARAHALLNGRLVAGPADIREVAHTVLRHRMRPQNRDVDLDQCLEAIDDSLNKTP